jgi:two-component system nitrate/nitrite response regulator NarP
VDSEILFADAIGQMLAAEPDFEFLGSARSGEEALRIAAIAPPSIALVAFELPGIDGLKTTLALKALCPDASVVIMAHPTKSDVAHRALDAGATGFVSKGQVVDDLLATIRSVADGEISMPERRQSPRDRRLPTLASPEDRRAPSKGLTDREADVLRLASTGLSNRRIAEALFLSEHTVLGYLKNVFVKLGVHSKLQAVMLGIAEGLIPMPTVAPADDREPAKSEPMARQARVPR